MHGGLEETIDATSVTARRARQVSFVDQVLLAQIMHMIPGGMPPLLASLMSHPSVRKVGVGLNEDAVKLKRV